MTEEINNPKTKLSDTSPQKDAQQIIKERKAAQQSAAEQKPTTQADGNDPKKTGTNWSLRILMILIVFLAGSGAGIYFLPFLQERLPIITEWVGPSNQEKADNSLIPEKIAALEHRLELTEQELQALKSANQSLDGRINDLPQMTSIETDQTLLDRLDELEQFRLNAETTKKDGDTSARIDMLLGRMSQLESSFVPLSKGLSDAQDARLERKQMAEKTENALQMIDQM